MEEISQLHAAGRPLLIGTRSIDKSEQLSELLTAAGIEHQVLNANHIAGRGRHRRPRRTRGKVTVSTNMAGRGTDIKLGDGVAEFGGLHVICTEMHDASRIDRQLIGRCGRQGDPGTFRPYLALDDDLLLAGLGPEKSRKLKERAKIGRPLQPSRRPLPPGTAESRAPPLPPTQVADVLSRRSARRTSGKWGKTPISIRLGSRHGCQSHMRRVESSGRRPRGAPLFHRSLGMWKKHLAGSLVLLLLGVGLVHAEQGEDALMGMRN